MSVDRRQAHVRREVGAYGLRLRNVEQARPLLVPADERWPRLTIRRRRGHADTETEWVSDRAAVLKLQNGGEIAIDRARGEAAFVMDRPVRTDELVHPLLAPVAAVMGYWLGRESFHAASFVSDGTAWGVVGDRESGKSTLVARLALDGVGLVCDDMLVLEDGVAFAGPRSIDLREEAAERLEAGEAVGLVGARERWRLVVGQIDANPTLGGWIFLTWGDKVELVPVRGAARVERLAVNRGMRIPPRDPAQLLELATLPAWELRRPRSWDALADAVACLRDAVG